MLTAERLRELYSYDDKTGVFVRREASRGRAPAGPVVVVPNKHGYVYIGIDRVKHTQHRLAWLYVHGQWPKNQIDHINGIKTDNRIENLREATASQNGRNKLLKPGKSGVVGVVAGYRGVWLAQIKHERQHLHLGTFARKEDAEAAYRAAVGQYHGHEWRRA